jgi:hypothetical protein
MSIIVNNAHGPNIAIINGECQFWATMPLVLWEPIAKLVAKCRMTHGDYIHLTMDTPRKPRSTGERSINNRIHGHCEDIAIQLADPRYDQDTVYRAMKRMSVSEGYPTQLSIDGIEEPKSMADASEEEALIVNRVIQRYADIHGFWLTEYDDNIKPPVPYRSLGGRSRTEMMAYNMVSSGRT